MVTPSEGCVNVMFFGVFGSPEIIPGVFALVTRWCMSGAMGICVGAVGVDGVWVVFFGVYVTLYAVVPNIFANFCKGIPMASLEGLILLSDFLYFTGK